MKMPRAESVLMFKCRSCGRVEKWSGKAGAYYKGMVLRLPCLCTEFKNRPEKEVIEVKS
jgi:hypothetical protein